MWKHRLLVSVTEFPLYWADGPISLLPKCSSEAVVSLIRESSSSVSLAPNTVSGLWVEEAQL